MCLAIPGRVERIEGDKAVVDYGGIRREVDISLVDVKEGEYVIVHAGFAIQVLDEREAKETLKIFEELMENA
ncbi:MAG TPA: HypC/HybG/HupF family hydrogenase formation chaperone [Thermoplasmatales archaeon]|nr:HypC/HybG/HupF family hydrogenase formation chaperone [Thermoplasmata archaeon]HHO57484.1 HypC/HybG/HupF family hydrogenase formation chaperone [Thermoplasmatales archaeon]